ncbi:MAG: nuclear transport factor 2 family protein [Gemmatimonadota bacterium]|nr:nuclear transport factor 2 family protein [Gemmatimonadota bacterium]
MRLHPLVVLPLLLGACAPRAPEPAADPTPEIRALLAASARAWNAGDLDGFLVTYARDSATTFLTSGGLTHGYDAIRARYAARFEPGATRDSLRFADLRVRALGPTHALVTARYVLRRGNSVTAEGPFTVVLERRAEGWRMIHDHTS